MDSTRGPGAPLSVLKMVHHSVVLLGRNLCLPRVNPWLIILRWIKLLSYKTHVYKVFQSVTVTIMKQNALRRAELM